MGSWRRQVIIWAVEGGSCCQGGRFEAAIGERQKRTRLRGEFKARLAAHNKGKGPKYRRWRIPGLTRVFVGQEMHRRRGCWPRRVGEWPNYWGCGIRDGLLFSCF